MTQAYFVSGIGTEIGKTICSAVLTQALQADYWKPIQAGELDDSDSHKINRLVSHSDNIIHPERYRLNHPMSPHAAAAREGIEIESGDFELPKTQNQNLIVEGAGGLLVPINSRETTLAIIERLQIPVILVSRYYLGSINHTLLSAEVLRQREIPVAGILFNGEENLESKSVILEMTGLADLGSIPLLETLSPDTINDAGKNLAPQLQKLKRP